MLSEAEQLDAIAGVASHSLLEMQVAAEALMRVPFFLLYLKMWIASLILLKPYRKYDEHTHAVSPNLAFLERCNQLALPGSRYTWSPFHSNTWNNQS